MKWAESEKRREEKRREEKKENQKRESLRRKKIQVREKVGQLRNTVFFQWFVAPEGRKVGSLKRRVRSYVVRWEIKVARGCGAKQSWKLPPPPCAALLVYHYDTRDPAKLWVYPASLNEFYAYINMRVPEALWPAFMANDLGQGQAMAHSFQYLMFGKRGPETRFAGWKGGFMHCDMILAAVQLARFWSFTMCENQRGSQTWLGNPSKFYRKISVNKHFPLQGWLTRE